VATAEWEGIAIRARKVTEVTTSGGSLYGLLGEMRQRLSELGLDLVRKSSGLS
jgi:hypothetical protein